MRKVRTHCTERTPASRGDPESQALARCKAALDALDTARRSPSGVTSSGYRAAFAAFVELRGKLAPKDRQLADEYSQILWKQFGQDLEVEATEAAAPPGQARHVDPTPTGRKARPSDALPGTPTKLRELERRRRLGMALHAAGDADESFEVGFRPPPAPASMRHALMTRVAGAEEICQTAAKKSQPVVVGFPHRLAKARRARGWCQSTLARKAELTQQAVSLLERGLRRPSIDVLQRLAEALRTTTDGLLGLEIRAKA